MPLPVKGLLSRELVNVPVQLLYARNELLKKIIANAAKRKSQLHIDATGARMAVTPEAFQFGKNVFSDMHKKSNWARPAWTAARGAFDFAKGVAKNNLGDMLEGMAPKAQGLKRYLELLTFQRARNMQAKADTMFLKKLPYKLTIEQRRQIEDAIGRESAKSLGTGLGTGAAGVLGVNALSAPTNKQAGLADELLRRVGQAGKGFVNHDLGHMLEAMTPKAQGLKRYWELLTAGRARKMVENAGPLSDTAIKLHAPFYGGTVPEDLMNQWADQIQGVGRKELFKSLGTQAATGGVAAGGLGYAARKIDEAGNRLSEQANTKQSVAKPTPLGFALPAAAIGAGAGGLYGAVMGPRKKKLRAILKGLISGGAAGGGAGLGLSLGGELGARAGYALPAEGGPSGLFKRLNRASIGSQAGAPLGALGGGMAGMLLADRVNGMTDAAIDGDEKDAAELPTPTSRGNTEKVKMPEAKENDCDCDPEGVQMTAADHDKDVKEAAASALQLLQKNNPGMKIAAGPIGMPTLQGGRHAPKMPAAPKPMQPMQGMKMPAPKQVAPQAAPAPMPAPPAAAKAAPVQMPEFSNPARQAYERNAIGRMYQQYGAPKERYERYFQGENPQAWSGLSAEQQKLIDRDVADRLYNQHGGAEAFMDQARMPMQ